MMTTMECIKEVLLFLCSWVSSSFSLEEVEVLKIY